jgi:hypothetical protein
VLNTFVAPRRLFAEFRVHTPWLGVLAVTTLVAMLATITIPDWYFVEQTRNATNRLGRPVTITSDPASIARWGRILAAFSAAMLQPMIVLGLAGLLALVFGAVVRGQARFAQYLAISSHALLVPALGALFLLPFRFAHPELELSLALFTPFLRSESWPFRLLASVNLFSLWTILLLALGVSVVNRTIPWERAAAVLAGIYLLLAVGTASLSG